MLQYLKLFIRKIKREKLFSLINILGLSLGIACSLMIYLYIQSELSHDKFHSNVDNIYRINQTLIWADDNQLLFSSTGPGVSLAIKEDIPEVEKITRVHTEGSFVINREKNGSMISFEEDGIFVADSNFFEVFSFPLLSGNAKTSLQKPHSIIMTKESADKYFPGEDPIGKTVQLDRGVTSTNYEVTGVVSKIPENSYIDFDFLLSMSSFPRVERQNWTWIWTTFETFVVLNEHADVQLVRKKLADLPRIHAEATLQRIMGISFDDYTKGGKEWKLYLQPFADIHLGSANVSNRLNNVGNKTVVNVLMTVGIFILLLSCINYMNLKTSQVTKYAKDTGVRKLMGSSKSKIALSYIAESFLFVIISIVIAVIITYYALPLFNNVSGKELNEAILLSPKVLVNLSLLALIMSAISGLYPALLLSTFAPLDVIRGKISSGKEGKALRNTFVIVQFAISIALISSTAVVYQQLNFTFNKEVGFQKNNLLSIENLELLDQEKTFVQELRKIPGVVSSSLNTSMPPRLFNGDQFLTEENQNKNIALNYSEVDEAFIPTMGIELLVGTNFSEIAEQDKNGVILNESAVKAMGWEVSEDVLKKRILYPGNPEAFTIIGIAKDFNYWSLQAGIEPMALFHVDNSILGFFGNYYAAVRIESSATATTLEQIENLWKAQNASIAFTYEFTDDAFASSFESTEQFSKSLIVFATLALFIAGLGLLGMIIYVVEQRKKEIGIRKVLGSNSFQVVTLMSKNVVVLVFISLVISIPFSYWAMNKWLLDFEYRVTISPWIYVFAGLASMLFAFSIVGFQTFRAAQMNPTKALQDE